MVKVSQKEKAKANKTLRIDDHSTYNLGMVFIVIYLAVLGVFCVTYNVFPGPEFLVFCFFIYAVYRKWTRRFIKDWVPFIALFLAYEAMYGIADNISRIVHAHELINAELQMFGTIPTLVLQQFYRSPVLDYLGAFFTPCTSLFLQCLGSYYGSILMKITENLLLLLRCALIVL